jgi:hypothetical protein
MVASIGRLSLIKGLGEEEKKRRGMASATATTLKGRRARSGDQEAQSICVSGRSNRSRPGMFRKARWRSHHRSDVTAASVRCGIKVRGVGAFSTVVTALAQAKEAGLDPGAISDALAKVDWE